MEFKFNPKNVRFDKKLALFIVVVIKVIIKIKNKETTNKA